MPNPKPSFPTQTIYIANDRRTGATQSGAQKEEQGRQGIPMTNHCVNSMTCQVSVLTSVPTALQRKQRLCGCRDNRRQQRTLVPPVTGDLILYNLLHLSSPGKSKYQKGVKLIPTHEVCPLLCHCLQVMSLSLLNMKWGTDYIFLTKNKHIENSTTW